MSCALHLPDGSAGIVFESAPRSATTELPRKVAIHALQIVARELAQGTAAVQDERARLAASISAAPDADLRALNTSLCKHIDEGKLDVEPHALREHLLRSVLARIAIDSPNYPSLRACAADKLNEAARPGARLHASQRQRCCSARTSRAFALPAATSTGGFAAFRDRGSHGGLGREQPTVTTSSKRR
jgi:hypothetical protein